MGGLCSDTVFAVGDICHYITTHNYVFKLVAMNSLFYYGVQFVLGGATVVGITLVAKYINPKYTGIVYALPVILIVAMIFIYLDQGLEISRKTLKSTFVYEFTLVYFVLAFYILLQRLDFWWAMGLALVSWVILATLIQFLIKV